MDWLQKGLRYGAEELDNNVFKNVQDIWKSYKVNYGSHKKMESWIDQKRKKD